MSVDNGLIRSQFFISYTGSNPGSHVSLRGLGQRGNRGGNTYTHFCNVKWHYIKSSISICGLLLLLPPGWAERDRTAGLHGHHSEQRERDSVDSGASYWERGESASALGLSQSCLTCKKTLASSSHLPVPSPPVPSPPHMHQRIQIMCRLYKAMNHV